MIKIIPSVRGQDQQGSGEYGAPRGNRKHNGVDFSCLPKSKKLAVSAGEVTDPLATNGQVICHPNSNANLKLNVI